MHDYVSKFEKLLVDLKNHDKDIKDKVKAMILLYSILEEYNHFVIAFLYGKNIIIFKYVYTTLTNLKIRNNNKYSDRASFEALLAREMTMKKKKKHGGTNFRSKLRRKNIARDKCAFSHKRSHQRKDCPKVQKKDGKKPVAANMTHKDEDSNYSLSITPSAYVTNLSEWILDIRATYYLCVIRYWFSNFHDLKSGAVVIRNDQPYRTMGI